MSVTVASLTKAGVAITRLQSSMIFNKAIYLHSLHVSVQYLLCHVLYVIYLLSIDLCIISYSVIMCIVLYAMSIVLLTCYFTSRTLILFPHSSDSQL